MHPWDCIVGCKSKKIRQMVHGIAHINYIPFEKEDLRKPYSDKSGWHKPYSLRRKADSPPPLLTLFPSFVPTRYPSLQNILNPIVCMAIAHRFATNDWILQSAYRRKGIRGWVDDLCYEGNKVDLRSCWDRCYKSTDCFMAPKTDTKIPWKEPPTQALFPS